jgi:hypothetical protein
MSNTDTTTNLNGQCSICEGWNCNTGYYVSNGGNIKCNYLRELSNENIFLRSEIVVLKQSIADLEIKTLTKKDIMKIFGDIDHNLNVSPHHEKNMAYLRNLLQHKNLSIESRYVIFQQAITGKYSFLIEGYFTYIVNENVLDFVDFLKYNMDDEEENILIEFIKTKSHYIFYALTLFFRLERPKLSEFLEDIMYETIIERHVNPIYSQNPRFTSGNWSVYRVLDAYGSPNLGKALSVIKKISAPYVLNNEIKAFVQKYPEAEKYAMLI